MTRPSASLTLEDILSCWRAVAALGGRDNALAARQMTSTIAREALSQTAPEPLCIGDRSIAAAADRLRVRAQRPFEGRPSFTEANDLKVLSIVVSTLAAILDCASDG